MIILPAAPFAKEEQTVIENNLLKNIATGDNKLVKAPGDTILEAISGAVIAAPALPSPTFSQDYFFYWVRDGAISIYEIILAYERESIPERKTMLKQCLVDYLNFIKKIQAQPQLNGIDILGEPKFNIDGTLWTGQWSRPQPDGAAYQAIALAKIAQLFLDEGDKDFVLANIYTPGETSSLLKDNLEYTAKNWSSMSIGPWEELLGFHFSVEAVQRRALIDGAAVALRLNDPGASSYYLSTAESIGNLMDAHWNNDVGYYFDLFKGQDIRGGGMNAAIIFGLVYGQINHQVDRFSLISKRALSSAFYVRRAFETLYQINVRNSKKENMGPLIGRYPPDLYDGNRMVYGNPWFLCSNMLAAFYYQTATRFLQGETITVDFLVQQFFNQVAPHVDVSINESVGLKTQNFAPIITALMHQADTILNTIKAFSIDENDQSRFHLSEQVNRATGKQASAPDLSWSYASLLTALRMRHEAAALIAKTTD